MKNRQIIMMVLVMSGIACCGQSLGDVARASREHAKQSTTKVVTNDDVKSTPESTQGAEQPSTDSMQGELDHMKQVFEQVCGDAKTDHGRKLSDTNRHDIAEAVKPLRARMGSFQQIGVGYKAELDEINKQFDADLKNAASTKSGTGPEDMQRVRTIRQEYESRKQALLERAKGSMRDYEALQKQLEAVSNTCPAAAATVAN